MSNVANTPVDESQTQSAAPTETASAEPAKHKKGTILFTAIKDADETLVPQAKEIVQILRESLGPVSKKDLVASLGGRIKSKQQPGRVLSFYKGELIKKGYLQVSKAE